MPGDRPLLCVCGLRIRFASPDGPACVVDGVNLDVPRGGVVALVGESGCGKTLTALSIARLTPPDAVLSGSIRFDGEDVLQMDERRLRALRGGSVAYVFQEPGTALNPALRVGAQIEEALRAHRPGCAAREEAFRLARQVQLPDPAARLRAYPHELSGGMQQRVMIAMAIASNPQLLVADEPTTALDVTIQAQILDLLRQLQRATRLAVLFITHNLGLVAELADALNVMYAGRIVEAGPAAAILRAPAHPYTRGLLAAVPRVETGEWARRRPLEAIGGAVPHPARPPAGCRFASRCPDAAAPCREREPELTPLPDAAGRGVRCWRPIGERGP